MSARRPGRISSSRGSHVDAGVGLARGGEHAARGLERALEAARDHAVEARARGGEQARPRHRPARGPPH
jgi:hypothetical protein